MADYPRVILEGVTGLPNVRWRIVLCQKEDQDGIPREIRYVELAEDSDKDAMGCQRWKQLKTGREGSMSDWVLIAQAALDLIMEKTS